jgi:hypothetical protein
MAYLGSEDQRAMPLFLLRDGSIRRFKTVPEGIDTYGYIDRYQRNVSVLLNAESEKLLLRTHANSRRHARCNSHGSVGIDSAQAA